MTQAMNHNALTISGQPDFPDLSPDTAVLCLLGRADERSERLDGDFKDTLILLMDDAWGDDSAEDFDLPQPRHIEKAFDFMARNEGSPLHICCMAGMSRSAAMAVMALRLRMPPETSDADVMQQLYRLRPGCSPNPLILRYIDEFLGTTFTDLSSRGMPDYIG